MRKKLQLLVAAAIVFCFSGFAWGAETLIKVSLQPCLHGLPTWWNVQDGKDKADNLKFELQLYPSGAPQNEALAANQWDTGAMGIPAALMAVLRYDAKIIGISNDESETNDIWVRPDSPLLKNKGAVPGYPDIYGTPEQWKGKKVLVTTISTGHYVLSSTLKALGLADRDVQITNIEQAQAITAFGTGQGDIVCLWAPFSYIAESKGWVKISSGRAAKVMVPGVIVARKAYAEKEPKLTARWLSHYMAKMDVMRTDPKKSEAELSRFFSDYCGLQLPKELLKNEFTLRPLFPVDKQVELMKDPKQLAAWVAGIANFFKAQGTYKEKDVEILQQKNFGIDPSFMATLKK
jgi:ABC-type nitrate/sulfonate/bicarbonate transport system substrate-binding protein